MANRTIEAILRLSSKLGNMAAFRSLAGNLDAVDRKAKAFNRSQALIVRGNRAIAGATMRYVGPALATLGGAATVKSFATIERRMERIGMTAEASGEETAKALDRVRQIADDLKVPVDNVVDGLDSLVASGKTMQEALAFLPSVAGTAHAADAEFSDMATTADAVANSFGIAASSMERAFDILDKGGKAGKFELKDMAAELPSLAPAFAALGYRGEAGLKRLVAALQTVRLETGTSGEAATSFMDVLTKMESSQIAANFKKMGVNLRAEMKRARAAGEDTLEAFIRISTKTIGGDMSKLPLLFTDKQMLIGMRALMNHTREFSGYMKELGNATGTVKADLDRLANDAQSSLDKIGNSWTRLKQSFGSGFVDAGATDLMDSVSGAIDYASAVNKGLEQNGVHGFWDRTKWGLTHGDIDKRQMARAGGYRTPDERRYAAYGEAYGKALDRTRAEAALPPPVARGKNGMPVHPPLPTPRPDPNAAAMPIVVPPAAVPATKPFAAGRSPRDAERDSMAALRSDPNGVADAIDQALADAGERAGRAIEDAARKVNESGAEAGSAFARMLDGIGTRIGEDAARAFKAGVGSLTVNARVAGPTSGRNVGRSGGDVVSGPQ